MRLLLAVVLLLSVSLAFGQSRVRGTITALQGDVLAVKSRDGKDLRLKLPSDVGVSTAKAAKLEELKGVYVGATATQKDGRMVALEVHTLPPQAKPGHTPWDLQPGSTMTNANLEGLAQASGGNEITLNYPGGSQKILVPAGTPVVRFVPGTRADLKPGEQIFAVAQQQPDGTLSAPRISVSKDGVNPPH
ncbi:MAG TPA: hypothetical protein VIQ55_05470 [Burkholderiales bacterium]|jgi:hypothetical protein